MTKNPQNLKRPWGFWTNSIDRVVRKSGGGCFYFHAFCNFMIKTLKKYCRTWWVAPSLHLLDCLRKWNQSSSIKFYGIQKLKKRCLLYNVSILTFWILFYSKNWFLYKIKSPLNVIIDNFIIQFMWSIWSCCSKSQITVNQVLCISRRLLMAIIWLMLSLWLCLKVIALSSCS